MPFWPKSPKLKLCWGRYTSYLAKFARSTISWRNKPKTVSNIGITLFFCYEALGESRGDIILRFLIGVVISDQASTHIFCEQSKSDAFAGFAEEWSEAFKDETNEQTGHNVWEVEKPNPLSIAASHGVRLLNEIDIFYKVNMKPIYHQR